MRWITEISACYTRSILFLQHLGQCIGLFGDLHDPGNSLRKLFVQLVDLSLGDVLRLSGVFDPLLGDLTVEEEPIDDARGIVNNEIESAPVLHDKPIEIVDPTLDLVQDADDGCERLFPLVTLESAARLQGTLKTLQLSSHNLGHISDDFLVLTFKRMRPFFEATNLPPKPRTKFSFVVRHPTSPNSSNVAHSYQHLHPIMNAGIQHVEML